MSKQRDIIQAYNEELFSLYRAHDLQCLTDNNYTYLGENVIAINTDAVVMAAKSGLYDRQIEVYDHLHLDREVKNPNQMQMELYSATADLKYRLGTLYLYTPYITVFEHSYSYINGKKFYYYDQKLEDARFNRELPVAFESLYKFWQRIADYISSFFPELLMEKRGQIYFHSPLQYIHAHFPQLEASAHYQWLWNFQENIYPQFNKHRKFFVHHAGYDSNYVMKFLNAHREDDQAMVALDRERTDWLPYLKEQLELCNQGYLEMMKFLNQIEIAKTEDGSFTYQLLQSPLN